MRITKKEERIKVGFLSAALSKHVTAIVLNSFFEHFDQAKFDVIVYAVNPDHQCPNYQKISKSAENLIEFNSQSDEEMVDVIKKHSLDVLVDLDGFVGAKRRGVFSQKPAPIQIAWMGTPATAGAPWIDYVLIDNIIAPKELEYQYTEKILRMPHSYFFNSMSSLKRSVKDRAYWNLPEGKFVFASFNISWKIDKETFLAWCEILKKVENSILWLFLEDEQAITNIKDTLEENGVDSNRLHCTGRVQNDIHLARFDHADLMLDSFICGAHTTCTEALYAELPVLTKIGTTFHGRVAASIIKAADMEDCITNSKDEYIERAIEIATKDGELERLKNHLKENKDELPLFDQKRWVRDFEEILIHILEK
ncbi:hypothetical protein LJF33_02835 [Emcibacteraceae bacterium Y4]|nr:hypothetical protein [Pseudemcibacter aquimaris]